ncbi:MAG: AMP-binding protein, partial [Chloroflexota bacterium]
CLNPEKHVLLLLLHHIIFDEWSQAVFRDELSKLYEGFVKNQPAQLPDLPIQYGDFALWQRNYLQGEILEKQLSYWKEKLANVPQVLDLPTDHPRPAKVTGGGARQSVKLPKSLSDKLNALSQQEGVTLFMTLLAGFKVLLYRYTNQADFVVGIPITNRNSAETEPLIGLFLNTLALRSDLSEDPTFRTLLTQVRETALEGYSHQDLPFEQLIEELQVERDLSRSPLVQVMFTLKNTSVSTLELPGLTLENTEVGEHSAIFDLTLILNAEDEGLAGIFEYNPDLFEPETIIRMGKHFENLLEAVVFDPDQSISRVPLLTEAERHQLLIEWNQTARPYPHTETIHELFATQVSQTPDDIALVFQEQRLTYRELDTRSNQVAHLLRQLGIGPGELVGICLERSPGMVINLLGILKAGAAYVPLDPMYPQERLAFMVADAEPKVLITQSNLQGLFSAYQGQSIQVDTDQSRYQQQPTTALPNQASATDLAYVIYTSGSTGKPKGVMLPHQAVVNFLTTMREQPGLKAEDRLLSVTTLSFDIAVLEIFLPLTTGAQLILVSRGEASDGVQLMERLGHSAPTVMQATPATWRMLLTAGWSGNKGLKVLCGGEAFPRDLANELSVRCAEVWNMYGPTETTIWSTIHPVEVDNGAVS